MTIDISEDFAFDTLAVRAGQVRSSEGEHSEALYPTSSFAFNSAEQAAARFSGAEPGNIYSRFTNPTVRVFEQRLAAMEGGEVCVATASGMSAISATLYGLLRSGDHVVASRAIFGTTTILFDNFLAKFGVEVSYVDLTDTEAWAAAIKANTRLLFLETPSNPLTQVADIRAMADLANAHDCLLVVDNVYATPALQRPLELGAHIVIHSATKYIDGQGRCMGGAVIGDAEVVGKDVHGFLRTAGPTMSPFNAWVFLKGLETLSLRMQRHCANALQVAQWLEARSEVSRVNFPGLASHPQHALAAQQQSDSGAVLSFDLVGGQSRAWQMINGLRIMSITANLGDTKSTVTHPATTTHGRLSAEARQAAGIGDGLVRISVGLEDVNDLIDDLDRAFVRE